MTHINTIRTFVLSIALAASLTACNTTRGIGEDIEATGDAISNAATEAKESLKEND